MKSSATKRHARPVMSLLVDGGRYWPASFAELNEDRSGVTHRHPKRILIEEAIHLSLRYRSELYRLGLSWTGSPRANIQAFDLRLFDGRCWLVAA